MSRKIILSLTVDRDDGSISLVSLGGVEHYMCDEPKAEKQRYLDMRVQDFVADYLEFYQNAVNNISGTPLQKEHFYVVQIKDKYYLSIDMYVDRIEDAVIFQYSRAVYVRESIIQDHEMVEDLIGFTFADEDIKLVQYNPPGVYSESAMLTFREIARQLCQGLDKSEKDIDKATQWLAEYATANQLSMNELNEMCWEDSAWFLDQIFG